METMDCEQESNSQQGPSNLEDDSFEGGFSGFSSASSPMSEPSFGGFSPPSRVEYQNLSSFVMVFEKQILQLEMPKSEAKEKIGGKVSGRNEDTFSTAAKEIVQLPVIVEEPQDESTSSRLEALNNENKVEPAIKVRLPIAKIMKTPILRIRPLKNEWFPNDSPKEDEPNPAESTCQHVDSKDMEILDQNPAESSLQHVDSKDMEILDPKLEIDCEPATESSVFAASVTLTDSEELRSLVKPVDTPVKAYLEPFKSGWKREVNLKEGGADIVYIHPLGLRLKDTEDLTQHLTEGLTLANFTYAPDRLDTTPENQPIIPMVNVETSVSKEEGPSVMEEPMLEASPLTVRKSGRIPVPSSHYKIVEKMENTKKRASSTTSRLGETNPKQSKLVIKLKPFKSLKSSADKRIIGGTGATGPGAVDAVESSRRQAQVQTVKHASRRKGFASKDYDTRDTEPNWNSDKLTEEEPRNINCSISCSKAMGVIPTLQCCLCLCLYHPECTEVGTTSSPEAVHAYVCKSCRVPSDARKILKTATDGQKGAAGAVGTLAPQPPPALAPQPSQAPAAPAAVTSVLPVPQYVVALNRRKFILVPNLSMTPPAAGPIAEAVTIPTQSQPEPSTPTEIAGAALSRQEVAKKPAKKTETIGSKISFMRDLCSGFSILLRVFQFLPLRDRLNAAKVCHLWRDLSLNSKLWRQVRIPSDVKISDWETLSMILQMTQTQSLDLRNLTKMTEHDWLIAAEHFKIIRSLTSLRLPAVSFKSLNSILKNCPQLLLYHSYIEEGEYGGAQQMEVTDMPHRLEELQVKSLGPRGIFFNGVDMRSLRVVSLTSFSLTDESFKIWSQLPHLSELALGNCCQLAHDFVASLNAQYLKRIRLEGLTGKEYPTASILQSLGSLPSLQELELINFDATITERLEYGVASLRNIHSLLIIPNFVNQSGTKINALLKGVYQLEETLGKLVWVFTHEFLQVTVLYTSKNNRSATNDSCVPILMPVPVPGNMKTDVEFWRGVTAHHSSSELFVVVSTSELQKMLEVALRDTRVAIVKVHQAVTSEHTLKSILLS